MMIERTDGKGTNYPIASVCPFASRLCFQGCHTPRRNCIKLQKILARGRLDFLPEHPERYFNEWSPEHNRLFADVTERAAATEAVG